MILPILLLLQAAPAAVPHDPADQPPGRCAALVMPLGYSAATTVTAVPGGAPPLPLGIAVKATLLPAAAVSLAVSVDRPTQVGSSAGVFGFTVATAGRYRVALGSRAWVDIVAADKALPSIANGHGGPCSGISKYVEFDLKPGSYRLQLVGSTSPTIGVRITPLP